MKTDWNAAYAERGEQLGTVQYGRCRPISDRTKARMVAVLATRQKLASVYYSDRSLICLMKDTRRNPYANVQKLKPIPLPRPGTRKA